MGRTKKIFKIIGIIFLTLLILLILGVGVIFTIDKINDGQEWEKLRSAGYVNQVSVGSHNLRACP